MTRHISVTILLFIASMLLSATFACKAGVSTTTNNSASPVNAATPAATATPAAAKKDIAGNYDASGSNPDGGGAYKASLVVTPRDDVYQFSWNSAGSSYDGVGVMTDSTVAVSWTSGTDGKGCGVVLYKIGPDGTLDGKAGYWGENNAEMERATRKDGTGLDGKYDVLGKLADGKEYKGTLDVKKDGQGYSFFWDAGNTFEGFGIKTGDKVAVGFGGKQCSFVTYEVKPDGTLDGKWGGQTSKAFGSEVAKKK